MALSNSSCDLMFSSAGNTDAIRNSAAIRDNAKTLFIEDSLSWGHAAQLDIRPSAPQCSASFSLLLPQPRPSPTRPRHQVYRLELVLRGRWHHEAAHFELPHAH